jgi:hypothetical protein
MIASIIERYSSSSSSHPTRQVSLVAENKAQRSQSTTLSLLNPAEENHPER